MLAYKTMPAQFVRRVADILRAARPQALTLEQIAEQLHAAGADASQDEIFAALRRLMAERRVSAERA